MWTVPTGIPGTSQARPSQSRVAAKRHAIDTGCLETLGNLRREECGYCVPGFHGIGDAGVGLRCRLVGVFFIAIVCHIKIKQKLDKQLVFNY